MKTIHSIIIPTSIIFIIGSIITVSMDLNKTTDNVSPNDVESRYIYFEVKGSSYNKGYEGLIDEKPSVKSEKIKWIKKNLYLNQELIKKI